jgi:hypothetical protein
MNKYFIHANPKRAGVLLLVKHAIPNASFSLVASFREMNQVL